MAAMTGAGTGEGTTAASSEELAAVDSWRPATFLGSGSFHCHLCSLTPGDGTPPEEERLRVALLEPDGVDAADPLRRTTYRCRSTRGCEARQKLRERRRTERQ